MFPLTVVTWRLGNLGNQGFEDYLVPKYQNVEFIKYLQSFESYFYLQSCQRLVFVFDSLDEVVITQFYRGYWEFVNAQDQIEPEIFLGKDALDHLGKIISSLDSIVVGETEIQGQFKNAFKSCTEDMSPFLRETMSKIIRVGKKVREHPLLKKGKISTISIAYDLLQPEFTQSKSIGVIGTGKMARGIIRFLNNNHSNLVIYTNSRDRTDENYLNFPFKHISAISDHEILITATDQKQLIDRQFLKKHSLQKTKYIIDLGVPRNCHSDIKLQPNLQVYTMEDLFEVASSNKNESVLDEIIDEMENHIRLIIKEYHRGKNKDLIVSLRTDLFKEANLRKNEILNHVKSEKEFDQFINSLIHISQQHLEKNLETLLELNYLNEN